MALGLEEHTSPFDAVAMNIASIAVLVLAGITFSFGAFYLAFYLKWRIAREHLAFALLCIAVAGYDAGSAGLYASGSISEGIFWQRLQLVALALASAFTIWFVELVTIRKLSRAGSWLVTILAMLIGLMLTVHQPGVTLSVSTPSIKIVHWGGREIVTYYESELGAVSALGILVAYVAYARLFWLLYRAYRTDRSAHVLAIIVGQVVYFASLLNDALVGAGAYTFVYVSEYAYLVVIMTMAHALLGRFVDLHRTVETARATLEDRVKEAIADVKVLRGFIPICASCKKMRDDQGFWTRLEVYLTEHSEASLTHGICPDCARQLYPELIARREQAARSAKTDG
jgi:hypothetical protein